MEHRHRQPIGASLTHPSVVSAAAFSPDGKRLVTGCMDNNARLWDAATGAPIGPPLAHSDGVLTVAFSPDGKTVATGGLDNTAQLWGATTGRPRGLPVRHSAWVRQVAFSPDGTTVVTTSADKTARLRNAASGQAIVQPMVHPGYVESAAFSPDGKMVVTLTGAYDTAAQLWDVATGEPIGPPLPFASPEYGAAVGVTFSDDGRFVVACDRMRTQHWDAPAAREEGPGRLATAVEAASGLALDERGSIRVLEAADIMERRRRLEPLGDWRPSRGPRGSTQSTLAPIRRHGPVLGRSAGCGIMPNPRTRTPSATDRWTARSGSGWRGCVSSAATSSRPRRRSPWPCGSCPMSRSCRDCWGWCCSARATAPACGAQTPHY